MLLFPSENSTPISHCRWLHSLRFVFCYPSVKKPNATWCISIEIVWVLTETGLLNPSPDERGPKAADSLAPRNKLLPYCDPKLPKQSWSASRAPTVRTGSVKLL